MKSVSESPAPFLFFFNLLSHMYVLWTGSVIENNYNIQQIRMSYKNLMKILCVLIKKKTQKYKNENSEVIINLKMLENTNRWPVC